MKKYTIGFQHMLRRFASSKREALRLVRIEARICQRREPRLCRVEANDSLYLYLSAEDARRDPDGSRAFAVISPTGDDQ